MLDVVICSTDDQKFDQVSVNLRRHLNPLGLNKIVRVPDARSMCMGYNRGARQCDAPWLVFCHDDIEILHLDAGDFHMAMLETDVFGAAGSTHLSGANWYNATPDHLCGSVFAPVPHDAGRYEHQIFGSGKGSIIKGVQALDGIFIACRRCVWNDLPFDETITDFTLYDIDFSYNAHLHRKEVAVISTMLLYHASHPAHFSAEKWAKWDAAQKAWAAKRLRHHTPVNYIKHATVGYDGIPDAASLSRIADSMRHGVGQ